MYRDYYPSADWEKIMALSNTKETPFLIVLLDRIQQKYEEFCTCFPSAKIYYAVKANPGVELLALLRDLGSHFDIASIYELDRVLDLGVTADRMSFGNTIKKARHTAIPSKKPGISVKLMKRVSGYLPAIARWIFAISPRKPLVRGYSSAF